MKMTKKPIALGVASIVAAWAIWSVLKPAPDEAAEITMNGSVNYRIGNDENASGKENHQSLFENVEIDRCIFCGGDRTEIARTDFVLMFSEFEYSKGSICKSCYHANAKQVIAK